MQRTKVIFDDDIPTGGSCHTLNGIAKIAQVGAHLLDVIRPRRPVSLNGKVGSGTFRVHWDSSFQS